MLPWVEKYRPKSLGEVVSQSGAIENLRRLMDKGALPNLLFHGTPGSGKTSTILAIARELYSSNYGWMVLEINGSDESGIGTVRQKIKNFVSTSGGGGDKKLVIVDEADGLTDDAQCCLKRIVEKFQTNARFCFICNYYTKMDEALVSRLTKFRFFPLGDSVATSRLSAIGHTENVSMDSSGLRAILDWGKGDLRRMVNLLQNVWTTYGIVTEETVHLLNGYPRKGDMQLVLQWLLGDEPFARVLTETKRMKDEYGLSLGDMLAVLQPMLMRLDLPPRVLSRLLIGLANVEFRLAQLGGVNEKIELSVMVATFFKIREL